MKKMNKADRKAQVKEITEQLAQGVQELFESERYTKYLDTMSRFHNYSANNCVLIMMQCPQATHVAGFNTWKNAFKRNVKKGEKAIRILAPLPFTKKIEKVNADGEIEETELKLMTFRAVPVFDISQTDGEELPEIVNDLLGKVDGYGALIEALKGIAPVPVAFEEIMGGSHGYYSLTEKRIAIKEGMSELQTVKTLIHEIAHALLHDKEGEQADADRRTMEVQAESVAYTVSKALGLETADYSFGYIAGWATGREAKELTASLEIIRKTASAIIDGVQKAA